MLSHNQYCWPAIRHASFATLVPEKPGAFSSRVACDEGRLRICDRFVPRTTAHYHMVTSIPKLPSFAASFTRPCLTLSFTDSLAPELRLLRSISRNLQILASACLLTGCTVIITTCVSRRVIRLSHLHFWRKSTYPAATHKLHKIKPIKASFNRDDGPHNHPFKLIIQEICLA